MPEVKEYDSKIYLLRKMLLLTRVEVDEKIDTCIGTTHKNSYMQVEHQKIRLSKNKEFYRGYLYGS